MNVLIVNQYVRLPWQDGGTRHFLIARELVRQGHEVILVASPVSYLSGVVDPDIRTGLADYNGVKVLWLASPPYRSHSLSRIWNMLVFAAKVAFSPSVQRLPRPDVVIGSSPHLFAAFASALRARAMGVPWVFEVRDLWPLSLQAISGFGRKHLLVRLFGWIERRCYRWAHRVVSLLPNAAEYMETHGASPGSVRWIPNGIDPGPLTAEPVQHWGARFVVTYAGTHGRANALDSIIEAAALLRRQGYAGRILFRLVGEGGEKPRLQALAHERAPGMVEFLEPVPKEQVRDILMATDICIAVLKDISLYRYGISLNKLFDYLAAGRPVLLAGDSPNNPVELSGAGLVVAPENPVAIAEGVRKLMELSAEERAAMGRAGRRYVEEHHSIPVLADRYVQVLQEVLEQ